MAPPPGGLLLSILPPKWAALTLTQCTQYCVPVAHLHIPHQIVTPTCFSVVFQVSSCSTHLLTARTIHPRGFLGQVAAPSQFCSLFVLFAFGSELPFAWGTRMVPDRLEVKLYVNAKVHSNFSGEFLVHFLYKKSTAQFSPTKMRWTFELLVSLEHWFNSLVIELLFRAVILKQLWPLLYPIEWLNPGWQNLLFEDSKKIKMRRSKKNWVNPCFTVLWTVD